MPGPVETATPLRQGVREAIMDLLLIHRVESVTAEMMIERAWVEHSFFEAEVVATFEAEAEDAWRDGPRAAAYAAAKFIRENPREVSFGGVHMFMAGDPARVSRERPLHRTDDFVDPGRQELDDADSIYTQLVKELDIGRGTSSAEDFVPDLMYVAVRPYLGHAAAAEELAYSPPSKRSEGGD